MIGQLMSTNHLNGLTIGNATWLPILVCHGQHIGLDQMQPDQIKNSIRNQKPYQNTHTKENPTLSLKFKWQMMTQSTERGGFRYTLVWKQIKILIIIRSLILYHINQRVITTIPIYRYITAITKVRRGLHSSSQFDSDRKFQSNLSQMKLAYIIKFKSKSLNDI